MISWKFHGILGLLLAFVFLADARDFRVNLKSNGFYELTVDRKVWLASGSTFLRANGRVYSNTDNTLQISNIATDSGQDVLGTWNSTIINYTLLDDPTTTMQASVITYNGINLVRFTQRFANGVRKCSVPNDYESVLSGFPTINVAAYDEKGLGYLSFGGMMAGDMEKLYGRWGNGTTFINDGMSGGPLVLFNTDGSTIIISSMSNFMAASIKHDKLERGTLDYGIMSGVDSIPSNYSIDFMIYYSDDGIKHGMEQWGSLLTKYYAKNSVYHQNDVTSNYLSYWTDNGAYYYWLTEQGKDYETTIIDVIKTSNKTGIPYRSVQYDSWWYGAEKGFRQGCFEWNGNVPSRVFPNTSEYVYEQTGLPVTAHNKFWDYKVNYATQNGGQYNFILDDFTLKALPIEFRFWDDLFLNATRWGLRTYEQDWLNHQTLDFTPLMTNLTLGRDWLEQMASAAKKHNISVQYCMSLPRHVLQSVEFDAVTQIRVTNDYANDWTYDAEQWRLGVTSLFSSSLNLVPFKDVFWTSNVEPGDPYGKKKNSTEISPEIHAVASILSAGPVGPGDKMGYMNRTLIMRTCNDDGLLLKPSKPITAIDHQIYARALGKEHGADGEVWTTYSSISNITWGIVFAADMKNTFTVTTENMGIPYWTSNYFWKDGNPFGIFPFNGLQSEVPLQLHETCTIKNFCLVHITPVFNISGKQVVLLGEQSKFVPMSPQRFKGVFVYSDMLVAEIIGAKDEVVTLTIYIGDGFYQPSCPINFTLNATLVVDMSDGLKIQCFHG